MLESYKMKITPVLLAGGFGTRLWPLSRKSYPKQFSSLLGDKSLFQSSALRLTSSKIIHFMPHLTVTNFDFRFIVGVRIDMNLSIRIRGISTGIRIRISITISICIRISIRFDISIRIRIR